MRSVVLATVMVLLGASTARAQPEADEPAFVEHGFGALGLAVSGSQSAWTHAAFMLQGGLALPVKSGPIRTRAHAFASLAGGTVQSDWSGSFVRVGGGAEALACTGILCGVLDLDVGYQSATLVEGDGGRVDKRSGLVLGPRFGAEIGGERVRFRGLFDFYRWKTHHDPSMWMAAGGLSLELAVRF